MTNENCSDSKANHDVQSWAVSLAERWQIANLPTIWCQRKSVDGKSFGRVSAEQNSLNQQKWLNLEQPLRFMIHAEKKPWGQELWYTGIEKRGICGVETPSKERLSLPSYLALFDGAGEPKQEKVSPPPLLKILDPHTKPTQGCLYIEVHQEKWETYVVTSIDAGAWPNGCGEILFGFSSLKLNEYDGNWDASLTDLAKAIEKYEDVKRLSEDEQWAEASTRFKSDALKLWNDVRAWFGVRKVQVGDVIEVPPGIPHSLQNGVRVVEFQTPTYERLIIAFNQKVLTQNHLDTTQALEFAQRRTLDELMGEGLAASSRFEAVAEAWSCIVDFPGFRVHRATLARGSVLSMPSVMNERGRLLFVISGCLRVVSERAECALTLTSEEACYLPVTHANVQLLCEGDDPALVLMV